MFLKLLAIFHWTCACVANNFRGSVDMYNLFYIKLCEKLKYKRSGNLKMPILSISRKKWWQNKDFQQNIGMNKEKQTISMEKIHLKPGQRKYVRAYLTACNFYHEAGEVKYPLMGCGWLPRTGALKSPVKGKPQQTGLGVPRWADISILMS